MRHLLGLAVVFVSLSVNAQVVENPYSSLCQYSYRSDSYGRGIESAFTGQDLRSRYHDEACYQLGFEAANTAIDAEGRFSCKREFDRAYTEGFKNSPYGTGVVCYNLGFSAGSAALGTAAREGNTELAGEDCVKAYQEGRADGKAGRVSNPSTTEGPQMYCYQLGHFEAPLFN